MEDLKQIQEFFSNPLNENAFVEAFKLEKALKGMGYDVKVKYLDDFGKDVFEIYFNNPADADESIFYDAKELGYDNIRVFANPQESLDEAKSDDEIRDMARKQVEDYDIPEELVEPAIDILIDGIRQLEYYNIDISMPLSIQNISSWRMREYQSIIQDMQEKLRAMVDDYVDGPKEPVDEAYIVTYAKNKGEKPASAAYKLRGSALAFMRDLEKDGYTTMLTQRPVDGVDEAVEEYNTGIYFDPDKASKRAKTASKSAMDKVRDAVRKAMTGDYKPSVTETPNEALADSEEKEANYDELYKDYKYKVDEAKPKKGHGEKISREVFSKLKGKTINYKGADYKVLDSDEAVLKIKHLEDGDVTTINLRQFNLKGMIEEIIETIELGRQLNEKLCKKGEAYRKKRMAAGEKSSAYLSGRAVKVCKGQMKG